MKTLNEDSFGEDANMPLRCVEDDCTMCELRDELDGNAIRGIAYGLLLTLAIVVLGFGITLVYLALK